MLHFQWNRGQMAKCFCFHFELTIIRWSSIFFQRCILCAIFGHYDRILRGHDLIRNILTFCFNGNSQKMDGLKSDLTVLAANCTNPMIWLPVGRGTAEMLFLCKRSYKMKVNIIGICCRYLLPALIGSLWCVLLSLSPSVYFSFFLLLYRANCLFISHLL